MKKTLLCLILCCVCISTSCGISVTHNVSGTFVLSNAVPVRFSSEKARLESCTKSDQSIFVFTTTEFQPLRSSDKLFNSTEEMYAEMENELFILKEKLQMNSSLVYVDIDVLDSVLRILGTDDRNSITYAHNYFLNGDIQESLSIEWDNSQSFESYIDIVGEALYTLMGYTLTPRCMQDIRIFIDDNCKNASSYSYFIYDYTDYVYLLVSVVDYGTSQEKWTTSLSRTYNN